MCIRDSNITKVMSTIYKTSKSDRDNFSVEGEVRTNKA